MTWPKGDPVVLLRDRLRSGDTVVDVGAHRGAVSEQYAQLVGPTGKVIAFEPDSRAWDGLSKMVRRHWPIIEAHALAVGPYPGERVFYQSRDGKTNSTWKDNPGMTSPCAMEVWQVDLDHFLRGREIAAVKIDVQGSELEVLDGCPQLLQRCPTWVIECWPEGLQAAGTTAAALFARLRAAGLTVSAGAVISDADGAELDQVLHGRFINLLATR